MDEQPYQYNPFRTPCNWALANDHAASVRPGKQAQQHLANLQEQLQYKLLCPCCYRTIHKQQLSLGSPLSEMNSFGCGYPLFYSFIKFCILCLVVLMINSSLILLYDTINYNRINNQNNLLYTVYISPVSMNISNGRFQLISIVSFMSQLLLLLYFRRSQLLSYKYIYKPMDQNQSHYSLIFYNFPNGNDNNEEKIKNYLERLYPDIIIQEVLAVLDMQEYEKVTKQIEAEIVKWKQILSSERKNNQQMLTTLKTISQKIEQQQKKKQIIKCNERLYFKGTAIVTFGLKAHRQMLIKAKDINKSHILEEFFQNVCEDVLVHAQPIPNPKEVKWPNLIHSKDKYASYLGIGNLTMITLLAVFFLVYFCFQYMFHFIKATKQHQQTVFKYFPTTILMIGIFLANKFILTPLVHKICNYQRHRFISEQTISFINKLLISMFTTTALMALLFQAIIYRNIKDSFGLIQQQTIMFGVNAILLPLVWWINPWYIIYKINKYIYTDRKSLSQAQANHLLQYPQYNIGKRYADVIKTVWFVFMYSNLIPVGCILSIFGLIVYYWVDKYNLLRRSSLSPSISLDLSMRMTWLLDCSLLIKSVGNIVLISMTDNQLTIEDFITEIILVIISVVYLCMPIDQLIGKVFKEVKQSQQQYNKPYSLALNNFQTTYQLTCPITFETSNMNKFIQERKKGYIIKSYSETITKAQPPLKTTDEMEDQYKVISDRNMILNQ